MEKIKAEIRVWHAKEPTFRESGGQVMLDDFQVVAKFDLRLPSVSPDIDGHRFAAGAYRLMQHIDLAWGSGEPFGETGAYARPRSRSTSIGDLIFVHIDSADLRVFEVAKGGFLPVKVFIGAGKQKRRKAA